MCFYPHRALARSIRADEKLFHSSLTCSRLQVEEHRCQHELCLAGHQMDYSHESELTVTSTLNSLCCDPQFRSIQTSQVQCEGRYRLTEQHEEEEGES